MSIYSNAVKKPITTIMIFVAVIVLGLYSMTQVSVDLYPEMEFPAMMVYTNYPGASASDIESNVSKTIESTLNIVSNLKDISSVSSDNNSIVTLEFEWGTNLDEASNDIRDALSFAEQLLPEDCQKPMVFKLSSSMMPIMMYAITAEESFEGIEKLIDEKIISPLNRIEGIGQLSMYGAPVREVMVDVDPRRMEAYNLSIEQIGNILRAENMNMPAGNIKMGRMDYPLRIQGEFESSDEIENIVVGNYGGKAIYLKDVAYVNDSLRDMSIEEKINSGVGVRLTVQKQSGANTVKIAKEVSKELEELVKYLPADVTIEPIWDSSEFIENSISNLTNALMYAGLFVILVILVFLGRWRATFIVVITIPISLIVSFIFLKFTNGSINIISLSSLSIAIGMVVDDAIVVLENITKHIERGASPREAAIYATNEVWLAVIITTLTIAAVFLPMTMAGGIAGMFFGQLGWIVTITVVTSTVAAITLTPMLASKLMKLKPRKKTKLSYDNTILVALNALDGFYEKTVRWALRHKLIIWLFAFSIFAGGMYMATITETDFLPQSDDGSIQAKIELQTGIRSDETKALANQINDWMKENVPETKIYSSSAGADDRGGILAVFQASGSNIINYQISLVPQLERERSVWEVIDQFRDYLEELPGIVNFTVSAGQGMSAMGDNTVSIEIYGYDFDVTNAVAKQIADSLGNISVAKDVEISRQKSKPELQLVFDQEKLMEHGLNTFTVSTVVRNRVEGMLSTLYRESGEEYEVRVRFPEEYRNSISDIENITIMNPQGISIKLSEIARVEERWSPPNIERKRKERVVSVSMKPTGSLSALEVEVSNLLESIDVPQGLLVELSGSIEDQKETFSDLMLLMLISLLLVYIVMASQFESFKMPFIIMFSILFAIPGVFIALYLTGTTLSVIAGIGAIMLIGIVVKNGIVLVDYINLMRDRGLELHEAIAQSGRSRLRPVLMTSLTTILGMLPLAMSKGDGSEIWSPMGIAVIGGLVFSTLVTLLVVPVIYASFSKRGERNKNKMLRAKFSFLDNNEKSE